MTMQFDYADAAKPNSDDVQYYMEAVNEEEGEMGYSVYSVSDTSVSEKLSEDEVFWESTLPDYKFASFYVGESSDEEIQEALDSKFYSKYVQL